MLGFRPVPSHHSKVQREIRRKRLYSGKQENSPAPAGLFIQADAQNGLSHDLMREEGIRGMDSAQIRIADQSFVTRRAKDSVAAGHFQPQVHDSPGAFDGTLLGGKNL